MVEAAYFNLNYKDFKEQAFDNYINKDSKVNDFD